MNPRLRTLVIWLSIFILLAYAGTFAVYVIDYYFPNYQLLTTVKSNEAVDFIWTSVSVLVGSVVAVALGLPDPRTHPLLKISADDLIVLYGWVWALVGTVAIAVWIFAGGQVPLLIKNAATTFVGLVIPVVANFLKAPPAPHKPDPPGI